MPGTILFIHGAWVTARCWDPFVSYFSERGYRCIAPSWPHKGRSPAELRAAPPAGLAGLGVTEIVDHYARVVREQPEPPILIGHSFGGLFVQLLLDRGLGRAGVAISLAPPRGIFALYPAAVRSNLPVLARLGGWRSIIPVGFGEFAYGFLNLCLRRSSAGSTTSRQRPRRAGSSSRPRSRCSTQNARPPSSSGGRREHHSS